MAASKAKKGDKGVSGGTHSKQSEINEPQSPDNNNNLKENKTKSIIQTSLPRHYINQMRGVALKTQQRLSQETKRGFCKRCDLLLIPGETCTEEIQNESKGRRKPWADVLVVRCKACETVKRFPQNRKRSMKLAVRRKEGAVAVKEGVEGS
ncbi:conserved hypothetical protein [Talaromyces stipitatus ATCC 10500]|uniref:RNAse P Rpr2/Rpp21 subunit domain protein n=1 Tax=Talaromyces stipitatus (strain ATCC 10500 / CBS 375.48 / QM 6759 / NRRL 1006) TaxID=441959 RepID=B8MKX7_TALSN|nr:uncharacterized protein TSTA_048340 [Talaromyces stipitatus ATCC 10500]EED15393.1 conserved hypothetical protein [Talaromyces stipitatus ATCC 10500]